MSGETFNLTTRQKRRAQSDHSASEIFRCSDLSRAQFVYRLMWRPDGKHADCETVNLLNRRVTAGQTETSRCQFICLSIQLCNSPLTPRGWTGCTLTTYSNLEQILKQCQCCCGSSRIIWIYCSVKFKHQYLRCHVQSLNDQLLNQSDYQQKCN